MDASKTTQKQPSEKNGLVDKEFKQRDSLLTELFQSTHFRTIYNIFVALLFLLSLNTLIHDYFETGTLNLDFSMMRFAFGKLNVVLATWVLMFLSTTLLLYPSFSYWANNRLQFAKPKVLDNVFLSLYIVYIVGMFVFPVRIIIREGMPPASTMIILSEQVRMIMKSHAFVRENTSRVYKHKVHEDDTVMPSPCPDFGKFLYFLFVPTLIYRDEYPRREGGINWKFVVSNFVNVVLCTLYYYYIFQRFCIPAYKHFGRDPFTPKTFLMAVFGAMLPGTLLFILAFFAVLHSWMNAFAEMLQFGDRMFYKDWWNSTSFSTYYRTWNIIVHDWLYAYVYKDFQALVGASPFSSGPLFFVFFLSALVHEYIIAFVFGFFYPVLMIMFAGFGVLFLLITKKRTTHTWNVFMWLMMMIGNGILVSLYCMEWYARSNCPPYLDSVFDYFIPRSWTCGAFQSA